MNKRLWIAGVVGLIVTASSWAGVTYTVVSTGGAAKRGQEQRAVTQAKADGENARIEFTETNDKEMAGNYLLTKDGGQTMYMVNTKEKSYMKWDMDAMMNMAGQMMQMMKFSAPKTEKLLEETGEPVAGYPTRHYRFRTTYNMEMNMGFIKSASTVTNEEDVWATTKIKDLGMSSWLKKQQRKTGNAQIDALIKQQMEKTEGVPLKMITTSTSTDSRGKSQVSKSTMEVTEIKETSIPAAVFEIPAGFEELKMEMPAEEEGQGDGAKPAMPAIPFNKIFGGKRPPAAE
jgi:hypothetical protein